MRTLILAISFLFGCTAAMAAEVSGVFIDNEIKTSNGQTLVLNGAGLREKFWVDVYVGSLYLRTSITDVTRILSTPGPWRIQLDFIYKEVARNKLLDSWREGFEKNQRSERIAETAIPHRGFLRLIRQQRYGQRPVPLRLPARQRHPREQKPATPRRNPGEGFQQCPAGNLAWQSSRRQKPEKSHAGPVARVAGSVLSPHIRKTGGRRGNGMLDFIRAMHRADEARLVGGWRQIHSATQHAMKELPETFDIAGADLAEIRHLGLIGKKQAEHRSHLIAAQRDIVGHCSRVQSFQQLRRGLRQRLEKSRT